MPLIHQLDGVKIQMYMNDHPPPHFHVAYGEYEAQVEIATQAIMHGTLPKNKLKKVRDWGKENEANLLTLFNRLNPPIKR